MALHALVHLWQQNRKCSLELNDIRASLKADQELGRVLDEQTAPPKRDGRTEAWERKRLQRKRTEEVRESRRIEKWKKWRRTLIADHGLCNA